MSVRDYVTVRVAGHLFGIEALAIQDVFYPRNITPVPLAAPEILGVLNLRGRIVTAVCARRRLGLKPRDPGEPESKAIGIEVGGDNYGLIVDQVESVVKLDSDEMIAPPDNLPPRWAEIIPGVFRLPDSLLVIFDAPRLLTAGLLLGVAA
ncbi:chemotaxis protein CheW [Caulobacter sp. ErkDOM-YI]|uniref:chemotaxis protein CheW n=1 Tax=unclassified Caulobacter TaxID=2648921 RepID=UPI003AF45B78